MNCNKRFYPEYLLVAILCMLQLLRSQFLFHLPSTLPSIDSLDNQPQIDNQPVQTEATEAFEYQWESCGDAYDLVEFTSVTLTPSLPSPLGEIKINLQGKIKGTIEPDADLTYHVRHPLLNIKRTVKVCKKLQELETNTQCPISLGQFDETIYDRLPPMPSGVYRVNFLGVSDSKRMFCINAVIKIK